MPRTLPRGPCPRHLASSDPLRGRCRARSRRGLCVDAPQSCVVEVRLSVVVHRRPRQPALKGDHGATFTVDLDAERPFDLPTPVADHSLGMAGIFGGQDCTKEQRPWPTLRTKAWRKTRASPPARSSGLARGLRTAPWTRSFAPTFFLASRRTDRYPKRRVDPGHSAGPQELIEGVEIGAEVLGAVVAETPEDAGALLFQNPPTIGIAATRPRGALELIIHAHDVCSGLGMESNQPACVREPAPARQEWPFSGHVLAGSLLLRDPWIDLVESVAPNRVGGAEEPGSNPQPRMAPTLLLGDTEHFTDLCPRLALHERERTSI